MMKELKAFRAVGACCASSRGTSKVGWVFNSKTVFKLHSNNNDDDNDIKE